MGCIPCRWKLGFMQHVGQVMIDNEWSMKISLLEVKVPHPHSPNTVSQSSDPRRPILHFKRSLNRLSQNVSSLSRQCDAQPGALPTRDRPKFGFGAEDNNLNCFSTFRFPPNIDLYDVRQRFGFRRKSSVFWRSAESSHCSNAIRE